MYSTASFTVVIFSASSSGTSMPNASSNAMTNSTWSSESAPRSSTKDAVGVTSASSTPSCSTMICFTRSSTLAIPLSSAIFPIALSDFETRIDVPGPILTNAFLPCQRNLIILVMAQGKVNLALYPLAHFLSPQFVHSGTKNTPNLVGHVETNDLPHRGQCQFATLIAVII